MQEHSAVSYETSQQHKDTSASRMTKDVSDTHKWFITCPQETHSQINLSCTAWPLGSLQISQSMLIRHMKLDTISSEHDL